MNGGWIQVMGPLARIDQFKEIETTMFGGNLQQSRWPPTNIADSPEEARARMLATKASRLSRIACTYNSLRCHSPQGSRLGRTPSWRRSERAVWERSIAHAMHV